MQWRLEIISIRAQIKLKAYREPVVCVPKRINSHEYLMRIDYILLIQMMQQNHMTI